MSANGGKGKKQYLFPSLSYQSAQYWASHLRKRISFDENDVDDDDDDDYDNVDNDQNDEKKEESDELVCMVLGDPSPEKDIFL